MFYAYVLLSKKDGKMYIGFSSDLKQRISLHEKGLVGATRSRLPVRLIFYEAYLNKNDALRRERYLKTDKGKNTLSVMLKEYLTKKSTLSHRTGNAGP
jgi:putative endonuclease